MPGIITDYAPISIEPITLDDVNNRIGINQPTPTVALDVVGAGKFTGTVTAAGFSSTAMGTITAPEAILRLASTATSAHTWDVISGGNGQLSPGVFGLRDVTANTIPITIGAGAPNTSIAITSAGLVGIARVPTTFQVENAGIYAATDGTTTSILGFNAGSFGYVGTFSNHPFVIRVNNAEVGRWTGTGLGIGGSPGTALDVINGVLRVRNTDANGALVTITPVAGTNNVRITANFNTGAGNLTWGAGGTNDLVTLRENGFFGINVFPSAARFEVLDSVNEIARFRGSAMNGMFVALYDHTNSRAPLLLGFGSNLTAGAAITDAVIRYSPGGTGNLLLSANGTTVVTFDSTGRFTSPNGITLSGGGLLNTASPATNATSGWTHITVTAGPPTGTPSNLNGGTMAPLHFDSTNNRLYFYVNGGWHYVAQTA